MQLVTLRLVTVVTAVTVVGAAGCVRTGTHGGPCTSGGHCDSGLACVDDVCITDDSDDRGREGEGEGDAGGEGEGDAGEGEGEGGEGEGEAVVIEAFDVTTVGFNTDLRQVVFSDLDETRGCAWVASPDVTPTVDGHGLLILLDTTVSSCGGNNTVESIATGCTTGIENVPGKTCALYRAYHGGVEERLAASAGTVATSIVTDPLTGITCKIDVDIRFASGEVLTTTVNVGNDSHESPPGTFCPL